MFAGGDAAITANASDRPISGSSPAKAHHHSHPSYAPLSDISTASEIIVVNHGTSNVPRTV